MIQLSKRLNAVAELLVHGIDQLELEQPVLADIGTDHAYLPVYLVQKKVVKKAYAADVRKGPLLHAKEHIEQYGLGEYIQTRLSDGGGSFVPRSCSDRRNGRRTDAEDLKRIAGVF